MEIHFTLDELYYLHRAVLEMDENDWETEDQDWRDDVENLLEKLSKLIDVGRVLKGQ